MARNTEISISKAHLKDIPAIQELARVAWMAHYPGIISIAQIEYMLDKMYATTQITREIEEGKIEWLLAFTDHGLEAFAAWGPHSAETEIARLHKLYAHPESKGKGLGKALIQEVERKAKAVGYNCLELNVNRENPTIKFYTQSGFSINKEDLIDIGQGFQMVDYLMRKPLNE